MIKIGLAIKENQAGMSAILIVVIISAASLIMAKSMSFLSLTELEMGDKENNGQKTLYQADACVEEALYRIRLDNDYSVSDETVLVEGVDCRFSVAIDGMNREIEAVSEDGGFMRTINVLAAIADGRPDILSYKIGQ